MLPSNPGLEAVIRTPQKGVAIIDLRGEIDARGEGPLQQAYAQAGQGQTQIIVLNFSEVDYINSTGIALIVSILAEARKHHRRVITFGLSDHYEEIFQITRLSDFMTILPDEEEALAIAAEA